MVVKALFTDPVMFIWWFWTQAVIKEVPNKIFDFWQFECSWCLMIYGNSHGYSSMKMYLQIQQRENIERAIPVYLLNYEQDTHWLSLTVGKKFSHCRWRRMRWNANMRRHIYSCRLMKEFSVALNWKKKKKTPNKKRAVECFYWTAKSYLSNKILIWLRNYHIIKIHLSTKFK